VGDCQFCKKPAGLFRGKHQACEDNHIAGMDALRAAVADAAAGRTELYALEKETTRSRDDFLTADEIRKALIAGWCQAVHAALEDGVVTQEEENRLGKFLQRFKLEQADVNEAGSYMKLVKGGLIRDLLEGKLPDRFKLTGSLPFQFQAGESVVWAFANVDYYEDQTRTRYSGSSRGIGIRIMKGVYYRMGAFQGEPIRTKERVHVDTGAVGVTTKHVYFAGSAKAFRVRHDKIIAIQGYEDGVMIQRDAMTAKPIILKTGDGWFTQNLLENVASFGAESP